MKTKHAIQSVTDAALLIARGMVEQLIKRFTAVGQLPQFLSRPYKRLVPMHHLSVYERYIINFRRKGSNYRRLFKFHILLIHPNLGLDTL